VAVVAHVLEEDATAEERDLYRLDVDVCAVGAPCVGADGVGNKRGEQAVEVEEEEDGPGGVSGCCAGGVAGLPTGCRISRARASTPYAGAC
jgi:hypothetical protein